MRTIKTLVALAAVSTLAVSSAHATQVDANAPAAGWGAHEEVVHGQAPSPGAGASKWRKFVLGNPTPPIRPK